MRCVLRSLTVLATCAATAAAMATLGAGPAHAAVSGQIQFTAPGTYQWTAPAGVDSGEIVLRGAAGGAQHAADGSSTPGGNGALVQAELPLTGGDTYTILVGGAGGDATDGPGSVGDVPGGAGGYAFGGAGVGSYRVGCHPSAGGGGQTAFYDGAQIATPVVVAGGGGGARVSMPGGAGDYPNGDPGTSVDPNPDHAAAGGTQSHGGAPGVGSDGGNNFARPGGYQVGGAGGSDDCNGGGGGGAGYYGGGGGSGLGGGGGGSSYVTPAADIYNATVSTISGSGSFTLVYGTAVAPTPVVAPARLAVTAGQPTASQYSATGWPQPLFVASGSIPPGLRMDTAGVLSGTPTTPGTYTVTLNAYNEAGITSWTEEVDVAPATPAAVTLTPATDSAYAGTVFAHDPIAHVTDAEGNPVAGCAVVFVDGDGLVSFASASPQSPQAISVTTDADGNADPGAVVAGNTMGSALITANCGKRGASASYTVTGSGPAFERPFPPAAQVGHRFSYTYRTEGTPQPTVRVVSGTLPTGLKLARTGALTGTPTTAGSFTFTMRATNGFGTPPRLTQTIIVAPASLLEVAATSAKEGDVDTRTRRITVSLSTPAVAAVTVHWTTSDGTATAGSDYLAASGTIRIAAGRTSTTITVTILGDTTVEPNEIFSVLLSGAKNATIATASAIQTIVNDDHA